MNTFSKTSFYSALGIVAYISLISLLMSNGDRLFGSTDNTYLAPLAFLSLFTLSATVVGGLILGKPVMMYLDNQKKPAVSAFLQTVAWLAGFTIILFVGLILTK